MAETINDLLCNETPVKLERIEKSLSAVKNPDEDIEAVLTALIYRNRTRGMIGMLGAFIHRECTKRIDMLAPHLEQVGAPEHAEAIQTLRSEISLTDAQIQNGFVDWLDFNPDVGLLAKKLESKLKSIDTTIWTYLQDCDSEVLDIPLGSTGQSLLDRLISYVRRSE